MTLKLTIRPLSVAVSAYQTRVNIAVRRNDGKKKIRGIRSMPEYEFGFRDGSALNKYPGKFTSVKKTSVLSLFSGCGGIDLGFRGGFEFLGVKYPKLPFEIIGAYDFLEDAIQTYKLNLSDHAQCADLTEVPIDTLPEAEVLLGGFPCQDFSSSGPKVGLEGKRGQLYKVMVEYMAVHKPAIVVGENVPYLSRLNGGKYLETILDEFEDVGYRFQVWELYGPDYGLPQSRRRLFLIGVRDELPINPQRPKETHSSGHISIDDALIDLEKVEDESVCNQSQYFVASKASSGGGQGDHTNKRGTVAYCIRANSRGRIQFHYSLDRRLTVRECARLQSFPDDFVFPYSTQRNLTLIGNAVPPMLAHKVACSIGNALWNKESQTSEKKINRRQKQLALI